MDTRDLRKGMKLMIDGSPCAVVDFRIIKPGEGEAFTRVKVRNLQTGGVIVRTYTSDEKIEPAYAEERATPPAGAVIDGAPFVDAGERVRAADPPMSPRFHVQGGTVDPAPAGVAAPAIGILIIAGLGMATVLVGTVAALFGASDPLQHRAGFVFLGESFGAGLLNNALMFAVQALTFIGGWGMLHFRRRGLAIAAALMVMTPCIGAVCVAGFFVGGWALIVLGRTEVKKAFALSGG